MAVLFGDVDGVEVVEEAAESDGAAFLLLFGATLFAKPVPAGTLALEVPGPMW